MICSTTGQQFYDAIISNDTERAIKIVRAQKAWLNLPVLSEIFPLAIDNVYDVVANGNKFKGTLLSIILRYYYDVRDSELMLDEIIKISGSLEYISKDAPLTLAIRYAPTYAKVLIPKLCAHGANIDGYPEHISPLIAAIRSQSRNRVSIIKDLIARGANVNGVPGKYIPLHEATKNEDILAVNLLLQSGADVNAVSYLGLYDPYSLSVPKNALWYALKNIYEKVSAQESYKILELLLLNGADPNQQSRRSFIMCNPESQIILEDYQLLFISNILVNMLTKHTRACTVHKLNKLYASDTARLEGGQRYNNLIDLEQLFKTVNIKSCCNIARMLQRLNLVVKVDDLAHPLWTICPISHCIMIEPVQLSDTGHIYDKAEIQKWLNMKRIDPLSGNILEDITLRNATDVHERIFTYLKGLVPVSQSTRPTKRMKFG